MNKRITILIVSIVCIAALVGLGFFILFGKEKPQKNDAGISLGQQLEKACSILTEEKAKLLLGEQAVKDTSLNDDNKASSDDIALSRCVYMENADSSNVITSKKIEIVVRTPRNESGRASIRSVFSARPEKTSDVAGFAEGAFWNEEFAQLNVLDSGDWYVIEYGQSVPQNRNLADTEKVARELIN